MVLALLTLAAAAAAQSAGSPAPFTTTANGAILFSDIQKMPGWENCTVCAGAGGNGTSASFSMQQNVAQPSMDKLAAQFNLGGSTPYSDALWWKQLGGNQFAHNFSYDLYFYIQNPGASQALEFDVNQSVDGRKYIFGTQCNLQGDHTWDVWDGPNGRWTSTNIPCATLPANTWNHLTLVFQRTPDNKAKFVSVTLNGVTKPINMAFDAIAGGFHEINVAFQMDGNFQQASYSVWLDKVSLTYW